MLLSMFGLLIASYKIKNIRCEKKIILYVQIFNKKTKVSQIEYKIRSTVE